MAHFSKKAIACLRPAPAAGILGLPNTPEASLSVPPRRRPLPLFPLNVVLFPEATLPLHVFEDRYKQMVQRCLDGDSRFGVVLIKSGPEVGGPAEPHPIGTVAHITQVKRLDDGRMLLGVIGEERFRIEELAQTEPYLEAQVELLEDDKATLDAAEDKSIREAAMRYIRLLQGLRGSWSRDARMPDNPVGLSYFIAGLLQVEPLEKQKLLEEPAMKVRLRAEVALLEEQAEALKERVAEQLTRRRSGWG